MPNPSRPWLQCQRHNHPQEASYTFFEWTSLVNHKRNEIKIKNFKVALSSRMSIYACPVVKLLQAGPQPTKAQVPVSVLEHYEV